MADSNITKKALAEALKELMREKAFEKISIIDISEKCDMNRKSFYYHFKDKYDLVNWIFDTEFIAVASKKSYENSWDFFIDISQYFYENRIFYRKALCIKGQNSFSNHFQELLFLAISNQLQEMLKEEGKPDFQFNFWTDALVMTIQRWLIEYENMSASEFIEQLKCCMKCMISTFEDLSQRDK